MGLLFLWTLWSRSLHVAEHMSGATDGQLVPLMGKVKERLAELLFLSRFYRDDHPFLVHLSACLCAYLICLRTGCVALLAESEQVSCTRLSFCLVSLECLPNTLLVLYCIRLCLEAQGLSGSMGALPWVRPK